MCMFVTTCWLCLKSFLSTCNFSEDVHEKNVFAAWLYCCGCMMENCTNPKKEKTKTKTSETESQWVALLFGIFLPYNSTTCRQKAILGSMRKATKVICPTKKHKRSLIFACFMILISVCLRLPSAKETIPMWPIEKKTVWWNIKWNWLSGRFNENNLILRNL